jgi:hypothetical protein
MSFLSDLLGGGTVPKLTIEAFETMDCKTKLRPADKNEITLPLVTSEGGVSQKYGIDWGGDKAKSTAVGESAPILLFGGYKHEVENLTIKTIIDATGVYRVAKTKGLGLINFDEPNIEEYLTELRRIVYGYASEMHQAPYLKLTWGKILASAGAGATPGIYTCVLDTMEINYELFASSGNPVRAEVTMVFIPYTDPQARPEKKSPDLTHIVEVKPGDNLAKLCNQIYESPDYYHQVAQVNGLASAYAIRPGMKLVFPPLDKNTR